MKKILLVPIAALCLLFTACGSETEEGGDEKEEPKEEQSEISKLQTAVDDFCACIDAGDDCQELHDKVDKMGNTLANSLKESSDKEKLGELTDLYTGFKKCAKSMAVKEEPAADGGSAIEAFTAAVEGFCACQTKGEDCISFQMDIKKYGDIIAAEVAEGGVSSTQIQEAYAAASAKMMECL
jgi:hypothetical protein